MGLKNTLSAIRKAFQRKHKPVYRFENSGPRRCQFEWMEERKYSVDNKSGRRSFKAFANDWNNEVSRRFREWSKGDDSIVQVRLKSIGFLQDFHEQ